MSELPDHPKRLAVVDVQRQAQLQEIDRTIRLAEVRCMPFEELLSRIEHLWEDEAAGEIVYRACEEPLSHNQLVALAESVKRLSEVVEGLPSDLKAASDRAVKRLLYRMPAEIAGPIVEPWLEHKRKFRREISYQVLRKCGITSEAGVRLLTIFQRTRDQECLRLLARNPSALLATGPEAVVKLLDDEYWRMRVVQSLLAINIDRGMVLSASYPREFIWAAGRQRDAALLPTMRMLLTARQDDLEFVSLYAWALGQIGARDDLLQLRALLRAAN